jgi:RimJ/RimL family protein N-acetyltransferase
MSNPGDQHPPIRAPLGDVTTDRLELRRFRSEDLDDLAVVFGKAEVWKFPYGRGFTREETAAFLKTQLAKWDSCGFGCWLAVERDRDRVIGYVGLSVPDFLPEILPAVEVGWLFDPAAWGAGYATEGARAALAEAFTTLGLNEVCSVPQRGNAASSRVWERIGMRFEREVAIPASSRRGQLAGLLYAMSRAEWFEKAESLDTRGTATPHRRQ